MTLLLKTDGFINNDSHKLKPSTNLVKPSTKVLLGKVKPTLMCLLKKIIIINLSFKKISFIIV